MNSFFKLCLAAISLGLLMTPILNFFNFKTGEDGLNYYGQVHRSLLNCIIHTIGMPFTIHGIYSWAPAVFALEADSAILMQTFFYLLFSTHYITVHFWSGVLCAIIYGIAVVLAARKYLKTNGKGMLKYGLVVSFVALVLQEVIGHTISSDGNSRLEAVPNAILYAQHFSMYHWFGDYKWETLV